MSRVVELIERIEAGEAITPADLQRTAALQALDMVVAGDQFVRESIARQATADDGLQRAESGA